MEKTKDNNGNYCPSTSVCHSGCKTNEQICPGEMDVNGCKEPDTCHARGRGSAGNLCDFHCPGKCMENEILCEGTANDEGCREADTCIALSLKLTGPDAGELCSGYCPISCQENEVLCPPQLDPCDRCPTEPVCRPAAKNMHGVFCDLGSESHNCPKYCDEEAGEVSSRRRI